MDKLMFNDKYHLNKDVLSGDKTMTRRLAKDRALNLIVGNYGLKNIEITKETIGDNISFKITEKNSPKIIGIISPKYNLTQILGIAQSYKDINYDGIYSWNTNVTEPTRSPGYTNKMFVRGELMPHQIMITDVRLERLQDISDEDCLKEGIRPLTKDGSLIKFGTMDGMDWSKMPDNPKDAFAMLIDSTSGKGTWDFNPLVFVYNFKLIK